MDFINMLKRFIRPRFWLHPSKGFRNAFVLGIIITVFFLTFKLYPQYCAKEGETTWPIWQFAYLLIFTSLSVILWLIWRQCYLCSGAELKIGIAFDSSDDNNKDWSKTKNILKELFTDKNIKEKVSLRFVPFISNYEKNKLKRFKDKYGFTFLVSVKVDGRNGQMSIIHNYDHSYDSFMNQTFPSGYSLSHKTKIFDILTETAHSLHEIILLIVGTTLYHSKKYEDAAVILRHFDESIARICRPHKPPRQQIRFLDMQCRLAEAQFLINDRPDIFELNRIRQYAETAQRYFDEFPAVATSLARIRFMVGDLDGAIELTESFFCKIESLLLINPEINPAVKADAFLNYAFLSFIQGHWNKFSDYFRKILSENLYDRFNWADLNDFIDYVNEMEQFEGIVCLRVIYQSLAEKKVDKNLKIEAILWCQKDSSRAGVERLVNRCSNNFQMSEPKKRRRGKIKK